LSKGALLGARHTRQFRESPERRNGDDCPAVDGIIEEAGELAGEIEDASTLDAALVATQLARRDQMQAAMCTPLI
jgi:ferritin-like metal-binding protein YciE